MFPADALGYTKSIPAFLNPKRMKSDLIHGVSFASAASGYDDLTANLSVRSLEIMIYHPLFFFIKCRFINVWMTTGCATREEATGVFSAL